MTKEEEIRSRTRATVLKAMGHPTRMFIIEKLNEHPHCVCELTEMIGADTSTISKHLSVLKNAGLVSAKKEGTIVYYSLTCTCIMDFIGCIENVIRNNLERQLEYFA